MSRLTVPATSPRARTRWGAGDTIRRSSGMFEITYTGVHRRTGEVVLWVVGVPADVVAARDESERSYLDLKRRMARLERTTAQLAALREWETAHPDWREFLATPQEVAA